MTADETPAQGDEPTTTARTAAVAGEPGVGADAWRVRSEIADQRNSDDAGGPADAVQGTPIGPAIRDAAVRLERIEVALTGWLGPLGGDDDRPPSLPPGLQTVLARLDDQAATAERRDEAFAGALRDLVDQLNAFAGTVSAAGAGPSGAEAVTDTVAVRLLDGMLPPIQALETTVVRRLAVLEALLAPVATAAPRVDDDLTRRLEELETSVRGVGDGLDRLSEGVAALQGAVPPPDPGPRLDEIAGNLGTLTARIDPLIGRRPAVDGIALLAAVADLASRLRTLDDLPASVERTRVELEHRLDAVAGLPDAVAAVEAAAERTGAAAGSLDALAELLATVRDDVVPLGTTLPAALARLEVELTVVGERTAVATTVARDAGTATAELRTGVEATLAAVQRLPPPDADGGAVGAALGRLEARAAEQARLVAAVQETVVELTRSAPADVGSFERTVVADLDAVGEQLDAVGRVLQQLVGTLVVVEAGTIGVTPRAERSHAAAQAALADLRAVRRR